MGAIIHFAEAQNRLTDAERFAQMPSAIGRETLNPYENSIPQSVLDELAGTFIAYYVGKRAWIAIDSQGRIYNLNVWQISAERYSWEYRLADAIQV